MRRQRDASVTGSREEGTGGALRSGVIRAHRTCGGGGRVGILSRPEGGPGGKYRRERQRSSVLRSFTWERVDHVLKQLH